MAFEITNSVRSSSIIRCVDAGTYTIALANLATSASETVNSASIRKLVWSTNNSISITRNATKVAELYTSGQMYLDELNYALANNSSQNIVITVTGAGTLVMEVTKDSTFSPSLTGM